MLKALGIGQQDDVENTDAERLCQVGAGDGEIGFVRDEIFHICISVLLKCDFSILPMMKRIRKFD